MLEFMHASIEELNADIPCFDPFDYDMSERDRREIAATWGATLDEMAWCAIESVRYAIVGSPIDTHRDAWRDLWRTFDRECERAIERLDLEFFVA